MDVAIRRNLSWEPSQPILERADGFEPGDARGRCGGAGGVRPRLRPSLGGKRRPRQLRPSRRGWASEL